MATPKVVATATSTWTDIIGSAASVAGMTWHNNGPGRVVLSFSNAAPASTDARHVLERGQAYYDKNGTAHCWLIGDIGGVVSGTAD